MVAHSPPPRGRPDSVADPERQRAEAREDRAGLLRGAAVLGEMRLRLGQFAAVMGHRLRVQTTGAVRRAHQRTGHDAGEPDRLGGVGVLDELFGLDPPLHGVVPRRRPQVLGDGEDVAAGVVQVVHRLGDLLGRLAHAEDQVRLGDQTEVAGRGDDVERRAGSGTPAGSA